MTFAPPTFEESEEITKAVRFFSNFIL